MKALTIHQPWATLIALGHKGVENRNRRFRHRGPLAIHAGKKIDPTGLELARRLGIELPEELPTGAIVAVTDVVDCVDHDPSAPTLPDCDPYGLAEDPFASGPHCLILRDTQAFAEPVPYRGQQGLFDVPDKLLQVQR